MAYKYSKKTIIIGQLIPDKYEGDRFTKEFQEWTKKYHRFYYLSGHWKIESIKRFIEKRGLYNAEASHIERNMSKPGFMNTDKELIL